MSSDDTARTPDDDLDRLMRGALPGEFSFFGRQKERPPPPRKGVQAGQVVGDYRLVGLLGQGGMGQVWEAEELSLKRRVALKLVRPDRVNEHTLDLFSREARAGGRLSHPGIVGVHGHGEADGVAWISMDFVEGAWTLKDFIEETARTGELPEDYYKAVAELVAELADALQAAHEANVIHRDLKPGNVLITPDEHPKVTDFGLAKITDETALSVTGDFAGTYAYMSPEQVAAKRAGLDHRTDLFSIGIVLYEMLTLRRPFEGDTSQQVAHQIMFDDPPDPRGIRSRVPRDLAVISGKCMEKRPDQRFESMAELAADLRRYLANESIRARPPSALRRGAKWVSRNRTLTITVLVFIAALIGFDEFENMRSRLRSEQLLSAASAMTRWESLSQTERHDALQRMDDLRERILAGDASQWECQLLAQSLLRSAFKGPSIQSHGPLRASVFLTSPIGIPLADLGMLVRPRIQLDGDSLVTLWTLVAFGSGSFGYPLTGEVQTSGLHKVTGVAEGYLVRASGQTVSNSSWTAADPPKEFEFLSESVQVPIVTHKFLAFEFVDLLQAVSDPAYETRFAKQLKIDPIELHRAGSHLRGEVRFTAWAPEIPIPLRMVLEGDGWNYELCRGAVVSGGFYSFDRVREVSQDGDRINVILEVDLAAPDGPSIGSALRRVAVYSLEGGWPGKTPENLYYLEVNFEKQVRVEVR